jgi:hypothetical protein
MGDGVKPRLLSTDKMFNWKGLSGNTKEVHNAEACDK